MDGYGGTEGAGQVERLILESVQRDSWETRTLLGHLVELTRQIEYHTLIQERPATRRCSGVASHSALLWRG
jgi:hypothetical protein